MTDYKLKLAADRFLPEEPNSTLALNPGDREPHSFSHTQHRFAFHFKNIVFQTYFPFSEVSFRTFAGPSDFGWPFSREFDLSGTISQNHTFYPVFASGKCIHDIRDSIQNLSDHYITPIYSPGISSEVPKKLQAKSIHNKFKLTLSSHHWHSLKAQSSMQISLHHKHRKNQSHQVICRQPVFTSTRPITF